MTTRRRLNLAGFAAGAAVLLATAFAIVTSSASPALATTPQDCFVTIDGKIHVNPACLTPTPGTTSSPAMIVNLRARANGGWVSADNAGASPLINNRVGVGTWERFGLFMQTDGTVALKALINNRFVSVSNSGAGALIANQISAGTWERFALVDNPDGSTSLRATNGALVWAGAAGSASLSTIFSPGIETEFDIVTAPTFVRTIALRAHANALFVSTASGPLIANRASVGSTERFNLYQLADGRMALQSVTSGYVSAENAGASPLIANRAAIGLWESFAFINNADGSVSLRSAANNRIVVAESGGASTLIANRDAIGAWEEFDVVSA
jgi:hypothetical protein